KSTGVSNSTNNTRYIKDSMDECLNVNIVHKFARLKHIKNSALLRCDTAEELSYIPDKSIDAVITDPPYFDNIQYSELADFFYVWLRLGLKDLYPWFEPEYSGHPNEIVQNEKIGKTLEFFNTGLTKVFNECHRVIKDDGLLIFTFHHNKLWAWESIGKILLDSKFYVSACPIVRSEGKSGFHSSAGNIRYDCIFVCRKRPSKYTQENWLALKEIILKEVVMWVKRTLNSGMSVTNADIFAIIMGKTIEYYTKTFPNIKSYNEPITLGEALYEMKSFAEQISESTQAPEKKLPQYYLKTADQLTLFIRESKGKYEKTT
ncbi:MAG: DNA methyltransferase, partial [candidate division WOR-3 bacterium]